MGGDEIHRARWAEFAAEQVRRARQTGGERAEHVLIAAPESAHIVAETVVPFAPIAGELPGAPAAGAAIPGLGDDLQLGEFRIGINGGQQRRILVVAVFAAGEDGGQIEAEAVHAAEFRPGAQRVHRQTQTAGAMQGQRVAASAVIGVAPRIGGACAKIQGVVDAAQ